jgi:hypothetical protein
MSSVFELPEYDLAFDWFTEATILELTRRKNPFSDWFPIVIEDYDIPASQVTSPSGNVVEFQKKLHRYNYSIEHEDVLKGNPEGLIVGLDEAADQELSTIIPEILKALNLTAEAFGNSIEAKGQSLSHDLLNQLLERVELSFDESGNPIKPLLLMGSEMEERFKHLPPLTDEQARRRTEIIERKRKEFYEGHRKRRLNEKGAI